MEAPIAAEETILDSDAYIHIVTHLTGDVRDVCNFARARAATADAQLSRTGLSFLLRHVTS